ATIPGRQVSGKTHPQRQVAGEIPDLSLRKALNVVVAQQITLIPV
nr:hypothetical protein [Tanacetum cinerariifolium]